MNVVTVQFLSLKNNIIALYLLPQIIVETNIW
jgi:hypothetical protein